MTSTSQALEAQVSIVLTRYVRQNGWAHISDAGIAQIARRLSELIESRGLPPRLRPDEVGQPGEMSGEEVASLVARLLTGSSHPTELKQVARQLVKACFNSEFKKCRESYHEVEHDGSCRRQTWSRVVTRVSGSHCVDCPYWTALTSEQHAVCLAAGWVGDGAEFVAHRDVYLPEDFRLLRQLLRASASERSPDDKLAQRKTLPPHA